MNTRPVASLTILVLLTALAGCAGATPFPAPTSGQNGKVTPSPGSGYNPISGTSPQD